MSRHVSWRTGGPARRAFEATDLAALQAFLPTLPADEPILFVGLGSNLLVRDGGYRGTVILMHNTRGEIRLDSGLVYVDAGVACPKLARFVAGHGLSGGEFLAGIPGTVGGALAMNAGCHGSETWDIVARVRTIDRSGTLRDLDPADFDIGYRHCQRRGAAAGDTWFVGAWFRLPAGEVSASRQRIRELLERRVATQPLDLPNAGSVFRNPPGDHAARLIEACGLKGFAIGGARVSEKHANFIVNPHGAGSAADIEALIAHVRRVVREQTGVELEPEVRIVGESLQ
jgi:UDP-N-acetylmuramate dehydrogenase